MVGSLPYWDLYKARENGTQAVRAVQNNDTSRTMVFSVSNPSKKKPHNSVYAIDVYAIMWYTLIKIKNTNETRGELI